MIKFLEGLVRETRPKLHVGRTTPTTQEFGAGPLLIYSYLYRAPAQSLVALDSQQKRVVLEATQCNFNGLQVLYIAREASQNTNKQTNKLTTECSYSRLAAS